MSAESQSYERGVDAGDFFAQAEQAISAGWLFRHVGRRRRRKLVLRSRPCSRCGTTTTSASRFFCAGCHFAGWWGEWA